MIRSLVLLVVVISLAVRLAGAPREADSEPDPTVTHWLAALRDEDETLRRSAAYSLKDPGPAATNAVRTLVEALQDGDVFVRRAVASALGEIRREPGLAVPALVNALQDADQGVREHAAIALAKIGLPAVPSLIELLEETDVPADRNRPPAALQRTDARLADYAAVSLAEIGPSAVPALMEAVRAGKSHTRGYARFLINKAGKGAYPTLLEALKDENVDVHSFAVAALAQIPGDVRAIPILNRLLRSNNEALRRNAAYALTAIGPNAVPTLIAALQDRDPAVRLLACSSLERVEAADPLVVTALAHAVNDTNVDVRSEAVRVLHNLGPSAKAAVPALAGALTDPEPEVRKAAAGALGYYGPEGAASVPALIAAVSDQDEDVRHAAIKALASMGAQAVESIPTLIGALQDESMVRSAAMTLGKLGKPAQPAIPELQRAVKGAKERRWEVLSALGDLRAGDEGSVAVLTEALADPDPYVQRAAASSLAKIGPAAAPAVPALVRALGQKSIAESEEIEALASIGPTAVPDLIEAFTDPSEAIRSGAARALAAMGKVDPRVVPALVGALEDPSPAVRSSAAQGLGHIGGTANVSALVKTMRDPVASVRIAAAKALGAIGGDAAAARTTLSAALRDVDAEVRAAAVDALGKVGVEGPDMATLLTALLAAQDAAVRRQAREELIKLGQVAVPALQVASQEADDALRVEASAVLQELTHPVERLIQQLKHTDQRIRQEAENRLRQVGAQVGRLLIEALDDSDPKVRTVAAQVLVEIGVDTRSVARKLTAILWEAHIHSIFAEIFPDLIEEVRPPRFILMSRKVTELPSLPWPPPRFSAWVVLPKDWFGPDNLVLKDVYDRLSSALTQVGFEDQGLFEVPDGFAIVTKVERIHEDGSSWGEPERWLAGKIPLHSLSLADYLSRLFLEQPGYFRLFAFLVTTEENIPDSGKPLPETDARKLLPSGGRVLPDRIKQLPFQNRYCHVLIYHFEKKMGEGAFIEYPSPLSARSHLTKAGILMLNR